MAEKVGGLIQAWEAWHSRRIANLKAPYGWLSLTGLTWLGEAGVSIPDFPGSFSADETGVTFDPGSVGKSADSSVTDSRGRAVSEAVRFDLSAKVEPFLFSGEVRAEIIPRGNRYAVRTRNPQAAFRSGFAGIEAFEPRGEWVIPARFEAYLRPQPTPLASIADTVDIRSAVGLAHFDYEGQVLSLEVYEEANGTVSTIFADKTSGYSTYGAGRFLSFDKPQGQSVTLDFNRAYNPPCTLSPYCTCPLAPSKNRLPIEVTAGEKFAGH